MPTIDNSRNLYVNLRDSANNVEQTPLLNITLPAYRTGVSLPDYRRRIAMHTEATTPLLAESSKVEFIGSPYSKLSWVRNGIPESTSRFGFLNPPTLCSFGGSNGQLPAIDGTLADNAAKAQALKYFNREVNEIFSPFQSKLFAGEIKETLSLLANPMKSVRRLYDAIYFRKASFDRLPEGDSKAQALADLWLQFRMGAMPLIYDINAILQILEGIHSRHFVKAYGEHSSTMYNKEEQTSIFTSTHYHDVLWTRKVQYFLKAGITQELLSYHEGLKAYLDADFNSTIDFAGTLYELTPFSWLLDYLVNIGDIIGSLQNIGTEFNFTVQTRVETYTEFRKYNGHFGQRYGTATNFKLEGANPTMITTRRRVKRSTIQSVIPPVSFSIPVTPMQIGNMVALFIQRML